MKKIGLIVAMDKEFAQLRTLLDEAYTEQHNHKDFVIGTLEGTTVILQQCGIGKVNSTIGAVEMIDCYHPDLLISTGVAGGADISLNPLDVVVASSCAYHDAILERFPEAVAVDMESCAIAQTCLIYKTPFISFRIISDVPLKDNHGAQYFDFWNRMAEGSFETTREFLKAIINHE